MPFLGDYLGQLLSEITMARMHADLEAVRLAEIYASHPLLRTLPVPHVRLPEVSLDVPVLVKASESPRAGESARGGTSRDKLRERFDQVLAVQLSQRGLALAAHEQARLGAAWSARLEQRTQPHEAAIDVHSVADDLTEETVRTIRDLAPGGELARATEDPAFAKALRDMARLEFLKLRSAPPRLMVVVTSTEIREGATPENVTRLRLKISEQGLEWTTIESEGGARDRLVPE